MAQYKMPKPIYFIGACALAAAAIFVGAQRASVPRPVVLGGDRSGEETDDVAA